MLLNVYLCGWLVSTIGALVAAHWLSERRRSRLLSRGSLAVLAGVLWPVLAVICGGTDCHRGCGQVD
jgi:nitrate reductase NapE component